ncbi:MAG: hypothetical protein C0596_17345 [Marinilabiliales bacterium]|nr:MAG: hypothetical protein C0596_17345 [Marinilabiliales bacterium]
MGYSTIKLEKQNQIYTLTLDNEKKLNSLSKLFFDEFDNAVEVIRNDDLSKVLIIKGKENVFSAGGDLKEIGAADYEKAFLMCQRVQNSFASLFSLNFPVIAALEGIVFGGGFELSLHCDIRFCTKDTVLRLPESDLGLIPGAGGISVFSRIFSMSDAAYYLYTGNQIPVEIALQKGFVQEVLEKGVYERAFEFAKSLLEKSPESLAAIKKVLIRNLYEDLDNCMTYEAREFTSVLQNSGRSKIELFFKNKKKSK